MDSDFDDERLRAAAVSGDPDDRLDAS